MSNNIKNGMIIMSKVSIIVPVYNIEAYIDRCIKSLLSQTISDIEIIAIDDGSTDSSYEKLKQYQDCITILHHDNHGVSYSRNCGIQKATGEYIMFVDGDDWIDSDMVESLLKLTEEGTIDIVRCGYVREYPSRQELVPLCTEKQKFVKNKTDIYQKFIRNYQLASPWCQLIRRTCIQTLFDENIKVGEDYLFNLALYTNASSFVFVPNTYYHYLYNMESATTGLSKEKIQKRCEDALLVYSKLYTYLTIWNIDSKLNRSQVSYRILKELNMKLLACFQTNAITKKEQKELLSLYLNHPLLIATKQKLSILTILRHIHSYTPFLLCMKMNAQKIYYFLGRTIYRTLYSKRSR